MIPKNTSKIFKHEYELNEPIWDLEDFYDVNEDDVVILKQDHLHVALDYEDNIIMTQQQPKDIAKDATFTINLLYARSNFKELYDLFYKFKELKRNKLKSRIMYYD